MAETILRRVVYLEFDPEAGSDIHRSVRDALTYSLEKRLPVQFTFNGTVVRIDALDVLQKLSRSEFFDKR